VKAPFAGRVASRLVDAGAMLSAGTPLLTLVDDSVLEFRAAVPSAEWGRVSVGAPVQVTVDAALPPVTGRVARVSPLVDDRTRTFEAVLEVPSRSGLVGGLFARAVIRRGMVNGALVVPASAIQRDGGTAEDAHVFVVAGGKAERKAVKVGAEQPDAIQVASGLAVGDQVVLDPPAALTSGARVQTGPAAPSSPAAR
jgi:RND family efflux transporter MFP subunit